MKNLILVNKSNQPNTLYLEELPCESEILRIPEFSNCLGDAIVHIDDLIIGEYLQYKIGESQKITKTVIKEINL